MQIPWVPLAMTLGQPLIDKFLYGGKMNEGYNFPMPDEKKMTLSESEIRGAQGQLLSDLGMLQMGQIADIKQAGAANRLPQGAVMSAIAGVGSQGAKAYGKALPGLKMAQKQSYADYYRALLQRAGMQYGEFANQRDFYRGMGGGLAKIATLWQMGAFNRPDMQNLYQNNPYIDMELNMPRGRTIYDELNRG